MKFSTALDECHNILELRDRARRRLPAPIFDFLDGAAETERTARRNTLVFDQAEIIPRCLVDVSSIKTSTRILGQEIHWPLFCSPTGASRFFHPEGELAVARAAAKAGILYGLATGSTYSIEDVAKASDGPKMFQLYVYKDRGITEELIERAKSAGYAALCLTVDTPVAGKRERDLRSGFTIPPKLSPRSIASFARHPSWLIGQYRRSGLSLANFVDRTGPIGLSAQLRWLGGLDSSLSWKDVQRIAEAWGGPIALKGVMAPDDARRAADVGISAVIVSNHGGRQLDGAAAPFDVLPSIVSAVGDRLEVILDCGIRRGVHILKALARGAKACSIGRPYLYGLGAGGEAGVSRALDILRTEFALAMTLAGCSDLDSINADTLRTS